MDADSIDTKSLIKSLRKCQDRCQVITSERDELKRRLYAIESEASDVLASANKAEYCSSKYAAENKRLSDELAMQIERANDSQHEMLQYKQQCSEAKKKLQDVREEFELEINDQRIQIENLQKTSNSALAAAESSHQTLQLLSSAVSVCISERFNLIQMLIATVDKLHALFYSPPLRPPIKTIRRDLTLPVKKEVANVREVAAQLQKELAEGSRSWKFLLHRLEQEARTVHQDMQSTCKALIDRKTDNWDHEAALLKSLLTDTRHLQLNRLEHFLASVDKPN